MKANFTREQIEDIRLRAAAGELQGNIAKARGVHLSTINKICAGKIYRWAPGPTFEHEVSAQRMFTDEQVVMMRHRYKAGMGLKKLAALYGCAPRTADFIVKGRTYKSVGGPRAARIRICPHCKQVLGVSRRVV